MITEIVLEDYPEDPVNLIVVREKENGLTGPDADNHPKRFIVEHILESRGTRDVVGFWEIEACS